MKRLIDCTDEELVSVAQKIVEKYTKLYSDALSIANEYGFTMGESPNDLLNTVFSSLKEKRDNVTKADVEPTFKHALGILADRGEFYKMNELISLFQSGQYSEANKMMTSLGIERHPSVKMEKDKTSRHQMDYSKYSINGEGAWPKRHVASEVVRLFANDHPKCDAVSIVETFGQLAFNRYSWYFLTENQYRRALDKSTDVNFYRRYDEVVLPNGERVYASNQYNIKSITGFINNVNKQAWNIKIEKI